MCLMADVKQQNEDVSQKTTVKLTLWNQHDNEYWPCLSLWRPCVCLTVFISLCRFCVSVSVVVWHHFASPRGQFTSLCSLVSYFGILSVSETFCRWWPLGPLGLYPVDTVSKASVIFSAGWWGQNDVIQVEMCSSERNRVVIVVVSVLQILCSMF